MCKELDLVYNRLVWRTFNGFRENRQLQMLCGILMECCGLTQLWITQSSTACKACCIMRTELPQRPSRVSP